MKRILLALFALVLAGGSVRAQNVAAASADREIQEERYRRLNSAVEDLIAAQASLQKRLAAMADEIKSLRDQASAKDDTKHASLDELQKLAETVKDLDKKREADKKLILATLEKIAKAPAPAPAPESAAKPAPAIESGEHTEHTVQSGESLLPIIAAYNEELKKQGKKPVTLKQVLEANPGLKPERMRVGQKVIIPVLPK